MEKDIHQIRKTVEDMHRLMEQLVALQSADRQCCRAVTMSDTLREPEQSPGPEPVEPGLSKTHYDEDELMTIKDGEDYFGRTKLYELRKAGKLITVELNARDKRLVRAEVVALARWRRR